MCGASCKRQRGSDSHEWQRGNIMGDVSRATTHIQGSVLSETRERVTCVAPRVNGDVWSDSYEGYAV